MTRTVRYVGGPLDGSEVDVTGWSEAEVCTGSYEVVDGWADPLVWRYRGPVPG